MSNKIYNNEFKRLKLGAWCQGQNWDPNTISGDGLTLNCNAFVNCEYNIGVQSPWTPSNPNAGIATTQGFITPSFNDYVRNTYSSPSCSYENRFYSQTPGVLPPTVNHGNFLGAAYTVGPQTQPGCSASWDVLDQSGLNPGSIARSTYCPDLSPSPGNLNKQALLSKISYLTYQINEMSNAYFSELNGGNTNHLLLLIDDNSVMPNSLKDTLMSKDFLSDSVLLKFFTKPNLSLGQIQPVFVKNAPVTNRIWQKIQEMDLPAYYKDTLLPYQLQNKPSARSTIEAPIALAKSERSYEVMHRAMMFLEDSTATHVKDSIAALIVLNDQGDVQKQLIELDLKFSDFNSATDKLTAYNDNTTMKQKYAEFKLFYITLMNSTDMLHSIKSNTGYLNSIESVASEPGHPCTREAQNILATVYADRYYPELKLQPESTNGSRLFNSSGAINNTSSDKVNKNTSIMNGVSVYPNPATSEVLVKNDTKTDLVATISTITGQFLSEHSLKSENTSLINLDALPNGIYLLNLFKNNKFLKSSKLIIAK